MDTTPNSQFDQLSQTVNQLRLDLNRLTESVREQDQVILKILQTVKRNEEAFELRTARTLRNTLSGIVHNLDHAIDDAAAQVKAAQRQFDVFVVDGENVKENALTIVVTKTDEGYNYSKVTDPETTLNSGTEALTEFFNEHPELFGERKQILVNVVRYVEKKEDTNGGEG